MLRQAKHAPSSQWWDWPPRPSQSNCSDARSNRCWSIRWLLGGWGIETCGVNNYNYDSNMPQIWKYINGTQLTGVDSCRTWLILPEQSVTPAARDSRDQHLKVPETSDSSKIQKSIEVNAQSKGVLRRNHDVPWLTSKNPTSWLIHAVIYCYLLLHFNPTASLYDRLPRLQ